VRTLLWALAALCCTAPSVAADSSRATPRVAGGEVCEAAAAVERAYARHAPAGGDGGAVAVTIAYIPSEGWHGSVTGPTGTRDVKDTSCRVVARAAGVIAALMVREAAIGPLLAGAPLPQSALPTSEPPSEPRSERDDPRDDEPDSGSATRAFQPFAALRIGAGIAQGLMAGGDAAVVGGLGSLFELELGGRHSRGEIVAADVGWDRRLTAGRASLCARVGALYGCGGIEAGTMTLRGLRSLEEGRLRGRAFWIAPGADAGMTMWAKGALSFDARGTLAYAVLRPAFLSLEDEPIHSPRRLSGRLTLGATYQLW
jgi:hypothetical protein